VRREGGRPRMRRERPPGEWAESPSRQRLPTGGGRVEVGWGAGVRGSGLRRLCPVGYTGQTSCLAFFYSDPSQKLFFYKWSFGEIIFISETNVRRQPSVKQF
jgi:hypothetical protein